MARVGGKPGASHIDASDEGGTARAAYFDVLGVRLGCSRSAHTTKRGVLGTVKSSSAPKTPSDLRSEQMYLRLKATDRLGSCKVLRDGLNHCGLVLIIMGFVDI